ncbi:hypothetical protein ACFOMG_01230 [Bacterioplanoides pacificum]|uniref:Uncharacterized protein n=1 Tax=Bacterioplanoides pacificum TaxID=1171596 RepID=A0ABV7VMH1_9GAMM
MKILHADTLVVNGIDSQTNAHQASNSRWRRKISVCLADVFIFLCRVIELGEHGT